MENDIVAVSNLERNNINCVFITDENYAMPTAVAITSILANKKEESFFDITVLGRGLSEETKSKILSLNRDRLLVKIIDADSYVAEYSNQAKYDNIPANETALLKFDIPNILSDFDKVLYLDCDVIVQKDLTELYETDIEGYLGAMTLDMGVSLSRAFHMLKNKYFNSGVMLFNLKKMRDENIPNKLKLYRENEINNFMDQDAFNMVFLDRVKYLPLSYNLLYSLLYVKPFAEIKQVYDIDPKCKKSDYIRNAEIMHFSSPDKPWIYNISVFSEIFNKYYYTSPYKDIELSLCDRFDYNIQKEEQKSLINTDIEKIEILKPQNSIPSFSIIIPTYNSSEFLPLCLDSVVHQDFPDLEIICVDDGSNDDSLKILKKYRKKDSRIKIITRNGLGGGAARNTGMEYATGKYLYFLDSGDFLEQGCFTKIFPFLEKIQSEVYYFKHREFDNETQQIIHESNPSLESTSTEEFVLSATETIKYYLSDNESKRIEGIMVAPWNKVFLREYLQGIEAKFDPIPCANDRTFHFYTTLSSTHICYSDFLLVNHRKNVEPSLAGELILRNLDFHFQAFESTMLYCKDFDRTVKAKLCEVAISDIFSLFYSSKGEQKNKIFDKIIEFFLVNDFSEYEDILNNSSWYLKYKLLKDYSWLTKERIKKETIVPVVFATNNEYASYLSVALQSLIKNSNKDYFYDVIIFNTELSSNYISILEKMSIKNVRIKCLNISSLIPENALYVQAYFSKEMYYRLLIPEVLYFYDKVIYLDCDIIIFDDVSKMLTKEISDNVLAVVNNMTRYNLRGYVRYQLLLDPSIYFNSGVLVFNNEAFINKKIKNECFKILKQNPTLMLPDQDILNMSCAGKVTFLDVQWNFQWNNFDIRTNEYSYNQHTEEDAESLCFASEDIKILHFTSGDKPWNKPAASSSKYFWKYAKESPLYEEIIYKNAMSHNKKLKSLISSIMPKPASYVKVSIIIVALNTEYFLEHCLSSLRKQTLREIEVICIDRGLFNSTYAIMKKIAKEDPRFIAVSWKGKSVEEARNQAVNIARGEYLAFLDADDFYEPKMLELMYEKAIKLKADVAVCGSHAYNFDTEKHEQVLQSSKVSKLLQDGYFSIGSCKENMFTDISPWTKDKIFKTIFIKGHRISFLKECNDTLNLFFVYSALSKANRVVVINQLLTTIHIGEKSINKNGNIDYKKLYDAFSALKRELLANNQWEVLEQTFINRLVSISAWVYETVQQKNKSKNKMRRFLKKVFKRFELKKYEPPYFYDNNHDKYLDIIKG